MQGTTVTHTRALLLFLLHAFLTVCTNEHLKNTWLSQTTCIIGYISQILIQACNACATFVIICGSCVDHQHHCSDADAGLHVSIPAVVEHHVESGGSSPEVDLLSNESFSWHPSSHSEEEDFDE